MAIKIQTDENLKKNINFIINHHPEFRERNEKIKHLEKQLKKREDELKQKELELEKQTQYFNSQQKKFYNAFYYEVFLPYTAYDEKTTLSLGKLVKNYLSSYWESYEKFNENCLNFKTTPMEKQKNSLTPFPEDKKQIQKIFGNNLKMLRKLQKLNQETLAHNAGISVAYLSELERGMKCPTIDIVIKISNVLRVPASELLDEVMKCPFVISD
ncbi:MAG: helix-turn-helix domain-containing protein [Oscillospiraceae bacterium]|nr:helix-turn-helix domain-containing protein [Oscillospiraceae bacterium]